MRLALLSRPKFAALVNKYAASNVEQTKTRLMKMGCYSVTQQYKDNLQEFLKGMNIVLDAKCIDVRICTLHSFSLLFISFDSF